MVDFDKRKVGKVREFVDQRGERFERGIAFIQGKLFDTWLTMLDKFGIDEGYFG